MVKKPDQSWRPCIDYRKINAITKTETYPIPRLDTLIDRVASAKVITKLDLNKGYWQIAMTEHASGIAAFITPWGTFQPLCLPFGCKNGPSTFQRAMNDIFASEANDPNYGCVDVYIDDIAVQSSTWELHLSHLDWGM